jgi:hypothetical protein
VDSGSRWSKRFSSLISAGRSSSLAVIGWWSKTVGGIWFLLIGFASDYYFTFVKRYKRK